MNERPIHLERLSQQLIHRMVAAVTEDLSGVSSRLPFTLENACSMELRSGQ